MTDDKMTQTDADEGLKAAISQMAAVAAVADEVVDAACLVKPKRKLGTYSGPQKHGLQLRNWTLRGVKSAKPTGARHRSAKTALSRRRMLETGAG